MWTHSSVTLSHSKDGYESSDIKTLNPYRKCHWYIFYWGGIYQFIQINTVAANENCTKVKKNDLVLLIHTKESLKYEIVCRNMNFKTLFTSGIYLVYLCLLCMNELDVLWHNYECSHALSTLNVLYVFPALLLNNNDLEDHLNN